MDNPVPAIESTAKKEYGVVVTFIAAHPKTSLFIGLGLLGGAFVLGAIL